MVWPLWKTVWQFLTKLNKVLTYNPATMLLGIYPIEHKSYVHKYLQNNVYHSVYNCQKLQATKTAFNRWTNKLWQSHTMQCHSLRKRNGLDKVFASHKSNKEFISRTTNLYIELLKLNNKTTQFENEQRPWNRHFSKRDIQLADKHMKDVHHYQLSGKYKSKPRDNT